jgi:undecaprenyl-diphosphatase
MPPDHSAILGIVEGLTEFLPISSTGHLILVDEWLGHEDELAKAFEIVIQLGAVIAVVIYYRARLLEIIKGLFARDKAMINLTLALLVAFLPAAVLGLAVHKAIEAKLMSKVPVAIALIVGGLVMIGVEAYRKKKGDPGEDGLDKITLKRAAVIGLAQCFSLIPGTSRSMTSIVGAQLTGVSTATAAEFSFLLAIPTLGAATVYKGLHDHKLLLNNPDGPLPIVIGLIVSFVVALVVIAAFLHFLKRWGLAAFGYYRVVFGALILAYVFLAK